MDKVLPPLPAVQAHVGPDRDGGQSRSVQRRRAAFFRQGAQAVAAHKGDLPTAHPFGRVHAAAQRKAGLRHPFRQEAAAQTFRQQMGLVLSGAFADFFQPSGQRRGKGRSKPRGFLGSFYPKIGGHFRGKGRRFPLRHQKPLGKRLCKPAVRPFAQQSVQQRADAADGRVLRVTQGDAAVPIMGHGGVFGAPLPQQPGNAGAQAGAIFYLIGQFRKGQAHLPLPALVPPIQQGDFLSDTAKQRIFPFRSGRFQQRRVGLAGKGRAVQQIKLHFFPLRDLWQRVLRVHQQLQQGILFPAVQLTGQVLPGQPQARLLTAQPINGHDPRAERTDGIFVSRVQPLPAVFPALQDFPDHPIQQSAKGRFRGINRAVDGSVLVQRRQQTKPGHQHGDHPFVQIAAGVEKTAFFPVVPANGWRQQSAQVAQIGGGHQHHGMGQKAQRNRLGMLRLGAAKGEYLQPFPGARRGKSLPHGPDKTATFVRLHGIQPQLRTGAVLGQQIPQQ